MTRECRPSPAMGSPSSPCARRIVPFASVFLCSAVLPALARAQDVRTSEPQTTPAAKGTSAPTEEGLARSTLRDAVPVETLLRTVLGQATKPVIVDWRTANVLLQADVGQIVEYNNFESFRFQGGARFPSNAGTTSLSLAKVNTRGTDATETIARTPYLQTGRPSRWELGLGYDLAFAEGVVTWLPSFLPEAQMVFSFTGEVRYLFYPSAWAKNQGVKRFTSLFKLEVGGAERAELERTKPAGMRLDPTRLDALAGARFDVFFKSGIFISPASLLALPLMRANGGLTTFWNVSLGVGYAAL